MPQLRTTGLNVYCELMNSKLTATLYEVLLLNLYLQMNKVRLREVRKPPESYTARGLAETGYKLGSLAPKPRQLTT